MDIRIGFGFDSHKLVTGRKLILGGIEIPYEKGALAVSDGDVVIHALCDALLGAIGEKDLGEYFPDDNPENINRNSKEFLKQIWKKVCSLNYKISNIDITIIIDTPSLKPYKERIKKNIARLLNLQNEKISVKAKRPEYAFSKDVVVSLVALILEAVVPHR